MLKENQRALWHVALCLLFVLTPVFGASAAPKRKICRPNICLNVAKKGRKAKLLQRNLDEGDFLVSLPKKIDYTGDIISLPPEEDTETTLGIKVPANRTLTYSCFFIAGKVQCYDIITQAECPGSIKLKESESASSYECDVECTGPDSSGDCDCTVLYNTCRELG